MQSRCMLRQFCLSVRLYYSRFALKWLNVSSNFYTTSGHIFLRVVFHTKYLSVTPKRLPSSQGRNFALKSGGTNSERERGALGSRCEREENGEEIFPPYTTLQCLGERRELSQRGPGQSPGRKRFYCNLISAGRLY